MDQATVNHPSKRRRGQQQRARADEERKYADEELSRVNEDIRRANLKIKALCILVLVLCILLGFLFGSSHARTNLKLSPTKAPGKSVESSPNGVLAHPLALNGSHPISPPLMELSLSSQIKSLPPSPPSPPLKASNWQTFWSTDKGLPVHEPHPENVLDGTLTPRRFWLITEDKGQVAQVALDICQGFSRVDAAFVHQAGLESVVPKHRGMVPQNISLWAIIEGNRNEEIYSKYVEQLAHRRATGDLTLEERGSATILPPVLPPNTTAFHLHHFVFELDGPSMQKFNIPEAITSLGINVRTLVFLIHSNWGDPKYTAVFALGAYGNKARSL